MTVPIKCYNCESVLDFEPNQSVGRRDDCHQCSVDLRCCKMCQFYDVKAYNECKEPMAPRILEKEKANFCDYYKLTSGGQDNNSKDDLLSAANALFKD